MRYKHGNELFPPSPELGRLHLESHEVAMSPRSLRALQQVLQLPLFALGPLPGKQMVEMLRKGQIIPSELAAAIPCPKTTEIAAQGCLLYALRYGKKRGTWKPFIAANLPSFPLNYVSLAIRVGHLFARYPRLHCVRFSHTALRNMLRHVSCYLEGLDSEEWERLPDEKSKHPPAAVDTEPVVEHSLPAPMVELPVRPRGEEEPPCLQSGVTFVYSNLPPEAAHRLSLPAPVAETPVLPPDWLKRQN